MSKRKIGLKVFNKRITLSSKALALILALVLMIGGLVGGTIAWLTDETEEVSNVFTTSDIGVSLTETEQEYKMVPGWTIDKDPKASVTAGSEDSYLFIKVVESGGDVSVGEPPVTYTFDDFIAYAIDEGWTALDPDDYPGIYYRVIDDETEKGFDYIILGDGSYTFDSVTYTWANNQVLTKPEVTEQMMAAVDLLDPPNPPTLSFTAYAAQLYKSDGVTFTPADAWATIPSP
jgi:predicted ribosomally synthesized peptide with SipW-like signal peptide